MSLAKEYTPRGVRILAVVSSSLDTHPQDGPAALVEEARALANPFPFLFDETQAVAKSFMAACTPEFYVFDGAGTLQYHGQACDARPKKDPPDVATCADLRAALDDVLGLLCDQLLRGGRATNTNAPNARTHWPWLSLSLSLSCVCDMKNDHLTYTHLTTHQHAPRPPAPTHPPTHPPATGWCPQQVRCFNVPTAGSKREPHAPSSRAISERQNTFRRSHSPPLHHHTHPHTQQARAQPLTRRVRTTS